MKSHKGSNRAASHQHRGADTLGTWKTANGNVTAHRLVPRRLPTPSTVRTMQRLHCAGRLILLLARECSTSAPEPGNSPKVWSHWAPKSLQSSRTRRCWPRLRHAIPTVNALAGSAETIPLLDASVDAVLAGNAMHWFDMDVAGPEIARVLAPDGILAGLWNIFDNRIEWVAELARVGGNQAIGSRDMVTNWHFETARMHLANGGASAHFDSSEQAVFQHGQRRTADTLVATFATKAGVLVMPEQERDAALQRIREFLVGNPETATGEFTVPMLTAVLRVRRMNTNDRGS